ncbi:Ssm4 ring finger-containing protein [Cryptosporidium canis]|uniref:Ssm4 ring finger-containing protein n=1 Tax=Cryptosporidium canis TaxID=195482 RepID=A0A9D5HYW2_9CRYT|nr:Ssm4 ring finger-containing protein [Cryptosporidium canis]
MKYSSKGSGISVLIESTTSSGESHGLYDYEKKTKFNQTLSIDDTQCSYIIFINDTGQLIVQPEFCNNMKLNGDLGQDSAQGVKCGSMRGFIFRNHDFDKEFLPILKLYLSKNSWFVEAVKDINGQLRTPNTYLNQSPPMSVCGVDSISRTQSRSNSNKGCQYKEDNKIWLVAPKTSPGIPLVKGDLLKFGRCKMIIHDIIATSSIAKEESSKTPFLPLLGSQDIQVSRGSSLQVERSNEVVNEPDIVDYSTKYLLDKVLRGYSKSDAKPINSFNCDSLFGEEETASRLISSSSISNNATCENLNAQVFNRQNDHATCIGGFCPSSIDPKNDDQTQGRYEKVVSCKNHGTKVARCCRICLSDDGEGFSDSNEPLNPLICPCDCRGSMQYVHLQCLRTWIESRLEIPSGWFLHTGRDPSIIESSIGNVSQTPDNGSSMNFRDRMKFKVINLFNKWVSRLSGHQCKVNSPACLHLRKFECELCKVHFPTQLKLIDHDGIGSLFMPLFRVPRPKFPYLVLVPIEGDFSSKIGQIVVSFGGTSTHVCIGRGHSSDIRLGEISVSRSHAQFHHCYSSGIYQICLLDMKSKFGSLVEFTRPLKLGRENLSIQIGRTLVSLKTFKTTGSASNVMSLFSGCIGRRMTLSDIQELKISSQRTKSANLTFDSTSELGLADSDLVGSLRNISGILSSNTDDISDSGNNKQSQRFRGVSNYRVPRRHSYIFDP